MVVMVMIKGEGWRECGGMGGRPNKQKAAAAANIRRRRVKCITHTHNEHPYPQ
jgi:hypothetical protein